MQSTCRVNESFKSCRDWVEEEEAAGGRRVWRPDRRGWDAAGARTGEGWCGGHFWMTHTHTQSTTQELKTESFCGVSRSSPTWVASSWRRRRRRPFVSGGRHSRCLTEHTCTQVWQQLVSSPFSFWLHDWFSFLFLPLGLSASASKSPSHSGLTRVSASCTHLMWSYYQIMLQQQHCCCVWVSGTGWLRIYITAQL